jgi:hypothetical protein
MEENHRLAMWIAGLLPIHRMTAIERQTPGLVGLKRRKKLFAVHQQIRTD